MTGIGPDANRSSSLWVTVQFSFSNLPNEVRVLNVDQKIDSGFGTVLISVSASDGGNG
ncbi:hypothetical protein GCM10008940_04570 [Microbulbifer agarilyticus]